MYALCMLASSCWRCSRWRRWYSNGSSSTHRHHRALCRVLHCLPAASVLSTPLTVKRSCTGWRLVWSSCCCSSGKSSAAKGGGSSGAWSLFLLPGGLTTRACGSRGRQAWGVVRESFAQPLGFRPRHNVPKLVATSTLIGGHVHSCDAVLLKFKRCTVPNPLLQAALEASKSATHTTNHCYCHQSEFQPPDVPACQIVLAKTCAMSIQRISPCLSRVRCHQAPQLLAARSAAHSMPLLLLLLRRRLLELLLLPPQLALP
jgi:hypothetical protein